MSSDVHQHPREALAERNAEAILDAAERLLARGEQTSVSALAGEAGLSRPTVYAPTSRRVGSSRARWRSFTRPPRRSAPPISTRRQRSIS